MNPKVRMISIDEPFGFAEGYTVTKSAEQIENYLEEFDARAPAIARFFENHPHINKVTVLKSLSVDEECRGAGLGTDIMSRFMNRADGDAVILIADRYESQNEGFDLNQFYYGFDFEKVADFEAGALMAFPHDLAEELKRSLPTLQ